MKSKEIGLNRQKKTEGKVRWTIEGGRHFVEVDGKQEGEFEDRAQAVAMAMAIAARPEKPLRVVVRSEDLRLDRENN